MKFYAFMLYGLGWDGWDGIGLGCKRGTGTFGTDSVVFMALNVSVIRK